MCMCVRCLTVSRSSHPPCQRAGTLPGRRLPHVRAHAHRAPCKPVSQGSCGRLRRRSRVPGGALLPSDPHSRTRARPASPAARACGVGVCARVCTGRTRSSRSAPGCCMACTVSRHALVDLHARTHTHTHTHTVSPARPQSQQRCSQASPCRAGRRAARAAQHTAGAARAPRRCCRGRSPTTCCTRTCR
jgi:hypothetical protein